MLISLSFTISQARKGSNHQSDWTRLANQIGREKGLRGNALAEFTNDCREGNQGKEKG